MKEIFEQYGSVIIAAVAISALVAIIISIRLKFATTKAFSRGFSTQENIFHVQQKKSIENCGTFY